MRLLRRLYIWYKARLLVNGCTSSIEGTWPTLLVALLYVCTHPHLRLYPSAHTVKEVSLSHQVKAPNPHTANVEMPSLNILLLQLIRRRR